MQRQINSKLAIVILLVLFSVAAGIIIFQSKSLASFSWQKFVEFFLGEEEQIVVLGELEVEKFASEQDFKDYLLNAQAEFEEFLGGVGIKTLAPTAIEQDFGLISEAVGRGGGTERVSKTNVQVVGIDEPDIVKTDGKEIYFAPEQTYWILRGGGEIFSGSEIIPCTLSLLSLIILRIMGESSM